MKAFYFGFSSFFRGVSFSLQNFKRFYLFPIILWLFLVVGLSSSLSSWLIPHVYDWFSSLIGIEFKVTQPVDHWKDYLKIGLDWGIVIGVKLMVWYILGRYMKYIVLILLSPLFAYLSERTEELVSGVTYPFKFQQFLKDILRGVLIILRNMFFETIFMLVGVAVSFIFPFLSPLVLIVLFLINSYFMAFNFFDYVVERKRMGLNKSTRYMRSNKYTLLGFGVAYNLVALFPFFDWTIAPLSATSGAVLADLELPAGKNASSFV